MVTCCSPLPISIILISRIWITYTMLSGCPSYKHPIFSNHPRANWTLEFLCRKKWDHKCPRTIIFKTLLWFIYRSWKIILEIKLSPSGQSCKISADFISGLLSPQGHGQEIASTFDFFSLPSTLDYIQLEVWKKKWLISTSILHKSFARSNAVLWCNLNNNDDQRTKMIKSWAFLV